MVDLQPISSEDLPAFRGLVLAYWQEIMPASEMMNDPQQQQIYFQTQFTADNRHPHWGLRDGRRIGFVNFSVFPDEKCVEIEDFYIVPDVRRQGNGTALLRALYRRFDTLGIQRVDLRVRRDTPNALAFWEAQGFMIAQYLMRQYRDPVTGTAFRGALSSDFKP